MFRDECSGLGPRGLPTSKRGRPLTRPSALMSRPIGDARPWVTRETKRLELSKLSVSSS